MALTASTLSGAITADQTLIKVASATGYGKGRLIKVDDEFLLQTADADAGSTTSIPVKRGQNGTQAKAHPTGAIIVVGNPSLTALDWTGNQVATDATYPLAGRQRRVESYAAAGAITLPSPGTDGVAMILGTAALAMTVAVPTKDMDGCILSIVGSGAAAHTVTFTSGLSGAGASYDVLTFNATAVAGVQVMACNGLWISLAAPAMGGTVTNLIGSVA